MPLRRAASGLPVRQGRLYKLTRSEDKIIVSRDGLRRYILSSIEQSEVLSAYY
jgi:hypothetical protein